MPNIFGQNLSRKELSTHIGAEWQAGGIRRMRFVDGQEDGTELVQFDTASGLTFNVLPSRGLDISSAKYCGASLCFETPAGEAHPAHFDPQGLGWIKTFFSGLLTTCGMTWAGAPCEDQGESLGLHGRYSHLAARNLKVGDDWQGNNRRLWVSGEVRESAIFGPNVVMRRTISTEVGSNTISIEDTVRNEGFTKTPLMLVYHINIGYPVLSEHSELLTNSATVTPRDAEAEKGFDKYNRFEKPVPGYSEQLFYHDLKMDRKGFCHAAVINPKFNNNQGLGILVSYRKKELPRFAQWKMVGAGDYVCGLEPMNCRVQGRDFDRKEKTLLFLKPGEEKTHLINMTVLPDKKTISEVKKAIFG